MKRAAVFLAALAFIGLVIAESASASSISLEEWDDIKGGLRPSATVINEETGFEETQFFDIEPIFEPNCNSQRRVIGYRLALEEGQTRQTLFFENGDEAFLDGFEMFFDPFIGISLEVIDLGDPDSFALTASAPLNQVVPAGTTIISTSTVEGGLTDSNDANVSMSAFLSPNGKIEDNTINGVVLHSTGDPVPVTDVGFVGGARPYGPFARTVNAICQDGGCTTFGLQISFTGAGGGDVYDLTATHEIEISPVSCAITDVTAGDQTPCDPCTNTYSQDVTVTYESPPTSGTLDVNGQSFPIGTSPQTVTLLGLSADGKPVHVTASFSEDQDCELTVVASFIAPNACNSPEEITDVLIAEIEQLEADAALNQGQSNALINKLNSTLKQLGKGNTAAAVAKLHAFLEQIENFITDGILTPKEAQSLIDCANAILNQISTNG